MHRTMAPHSGFGKIYRTGTGMISVLVPVSAKNSGFGRSLLVKIAQNSVHVVCRYMAGPTTNVRHFEIRLIEQNSERVKHNL